MTEQDYNSKIQQGINSINSRNGYKGNPLEWLKDQYKDITGITANENVANQNLDFQRNMFEYNKAIQAQQWEREDTAYQRTAQDMIKAGLNPLSMQGTNGAGEVVSNTPIQNNMQYPTASPTDLLSTVVGTVQAVHQMKTGQLERDSLRLDNETKHLQNLVYAHKHGIDIKNGTVTDPYDWLPDQKRNYEHDKKIGRYGSDTEIEKVLTTLVDLMNGRGKEITDEIKNSPVAETIKDVIDDLSDHVEGKPIVQDYRRLQEFNESRKKAKQKKTDSTNLDRSAITKFLIIPGTNQNKLSEFYEENKSIFEKYGIRKITIMNMTKKQARGLNNSKNAIDYLLDIQKSQSGKF